MTKISKRTLFWTPRALAIVYVALSSLFVLPVFFGKIYSFAGFFIVLILHLIPAAVFLGVLVLAWRWEWIGALFYAAFGALSIILWLRRSDSSRNYLRFNSSDRRPGLSCRRALPGWMAEAQPASPYTILVSAGGKPFLHSSREHLRTLRVPYPFAVFAKGWVSPCPLKLSFESLVQPAPTHSASPDQLLPTHTSENYSIPTALVPARVRVSPGCDGCTAASRSVSPESIH